MIATESVMKRIVVIAGALGIAGIAAAATIGARAAGDVTAPAAGARSAPAYVPRGGMPMTGMPMTGMPMTGMPMTGMPMTGMPMTGMPMAGWRTAAASAGPTQPGQGAFGAIQEVVRILEADPNTDWSKVNLDALRGHLIDMDEVTLHADAAVQHIAGGIEVAVTGKGRTLEAIRRMVPEDARHLNGTNGWTVATAPLADGVSLTVTASDPRQVAIIRGLGFAGVLASGGYHPMHHLMIARGEPMG